MQNSRKNPALTCQSGNHHLWLSEYLQIRGHLASYGSDFQCDPACTRPGCKNLDLQIPVSIVDLLGAARYRNESVSAIYTRHYSLGVYSNHEDDWIRLVSLKLKKPCPFLENDRCGIYPVRPLPCIVFPEYLVNEGVFEENANKAHFKDYLCLHRPFILSPERAKVVAKLRTMWEKERLISSFYLFNQGSCYIDFSNLQNELLEAAGNLKEAKSKESSGPVRIIPNRVIEQFFLEWMADCQPLGGVKEKIDHLNNQEGQREFLQLWQDDQLMKKLNNAADDRVPIFRLIKGKLKARRRSLVPAEYNFY